jgi:hypothetical protein
MSPLLVAAMIGGACLAGWWGWWRASKNIYRRSMFEPDPPGGMTRRDYDRAVRRRRKLRRVVMTVVYALLGALVVWGMMGSRL